jgi:hypothetical protein
MIFEYFGVKKLGNFLLKLLLLGFEKNDNNIVFCEIYQSFRRKLERIEENIDHNIDP